MFLHRLHLNQRNKEVRRDLADPYEMHSTLCRAFSPPDRKCPQGEFLWRLEPETDPSGNPRALVQSRSIPDWSRIGVKDWFAYEPDPPVNLISHLKLESLLPGQKFRYRLRANPSKTDIRNGKRLGLFRLEEQEKWFARKGVHHGFSVESIHISEEKMARGKRHNDISISIFSVLFDGVLVTTEPEKFRNVVNSGIGHGKAMGLGLFSIVPIR
jgi:CRISPR system Cascade subunit CasE